MNKNTDKCISFNLDNNLFRGRIVRVNHILQETFARRKYPQNVCAALSETTALSVMLADLLKFDGLFTLQIQGNGAISVLVADVTSNGKVRTCAKFDENAMQKAQKLRKTVGQIESTPYWLGKGSLIFTIDQGKNTDLYQGVVDLQGKTLAECAMRYFKYSEQIDTYLQLYRQPTADGWEAAGILIQKMPVNGGNTSVEDKSDINEKFNECKILLDSLQPQEIFDENLSLNDLLYRLYHEHDVRVVKENNFSFSCRCSRDKLLNTLRSMGEKNIEEMAENGRIVATCKFCGQIYSFDKSELLTH